MIQNYIIEGVDRLGKSTLINGIKNKLGFFQVIHYVKPELLKCYIQADAKESYQSDSFAKMFEMLNIGGFIMDRSHIGEAVYAKRYRDYDGSYVFDLEKDFIDVSDFADNTLLVLLTTSDFSFIQDDGFSFDFSKKQEEQEDFKKAFELSIIKNKIMIDVSWNGFYKPAKEILDSVLRHQEM